MLTKYEDIFTRFERGNMGEEEFQEQLKNELPNPAPAMDNFLLPETCRKVAVGFSNNPYLSTMKSERYESFSQEHSPPRPYTSRLTGGWLSLPAMPAER
jgi:hypothetical protein